MIETVLNGIECGCLYCTIGILFQAGVIAWELRKHFSR